MIKVNWYKKGWVIGIIILFIGIGIQPVFANDISINTDTTKRNNDSGDLGFCTIFCTVYHFNYILRIHALAFLVKFELRDLDTGELIQEKSRFFGFHLFTNLQLGNDYEITVTSPLGSNTIRLKNIRMINFETLVIVFTNKT
jgi:hypothetical protein